MKTSEQINEIATALSKAQKQMTGATKGANNPFLKSKYSDLSMVIDAISKPFADNELCFIQAVEMNETKVSVTTRIMHSSGQFFESVTELQPVKLDPQSVGSAATYAKRYGLQGLAGVPSVDDDGNSASKQSKQEYSDDKFKINFPKWMDLVESGEKNATAIITQMSNAFNLKKEQLEALMSLKDIENKKESE